MSDGWTAIDQDQNQEHFYRAGRALCGRFTISGLYTLTATPWGLKACPACIALLASEDQRQQETAQAGGGEGE